MAEKSLSNAFLESIETFVSNVVSGEITNSIVNTLLVLAVIIWVYFGLKIFFDARIRYNIGIFGQILFLIFGVISGPIGLFLYNLTKPKYTPEELDFIKIEHKFYHHQASKVLDCMKCGAYVLEDHTYCTNCGTQNRFKCETCESLTDYDDKYCYSCGCEFSGRKQKLMSNYLEPKISDQKKILGETRDINKIYDSLKSNISNTISKTKSSINSIREKETKVSSKTDFANINQSESPKPQETSEKSKAQKSTNSSKKKNKKRKK